MNKKLILEIGDIIRIKKNWKLEELTAEEIEKTYEFKMFLKTYPELKRLALE